MRANAAGKARAAPLASLTWNGWISGCTLHSRQRSGTGVSLEGPRGVLEGPGAASETTGEGLAHPATGVR